MRLLNRLGSAANQELEFTIVAGQFAVEVLEAFWATRKIWSPCQGDVTLEIRKRDPEIAELIDVMLDRSLSLARRVSSATDIAVRVLGDEAFTASPMKGPLIQSGLFA